MDEELYKKGMAVRRKVLGDKHVARRQESPDRLPSSRMSLLPSSHGAKSGAVRSCR
jgi:hypothetical protein